MNDGRLDFQDRQLLWSQHKQTGLLQVCIVEASTGRLVEQVTGAEAEEVVRLVNALLYFSREE